ncbi:MAG: DUF2441 domain-containing protein [Bacilli bacterium]|nr:DUF2441 domain-containing protein [Bacilli bacterium]
MKVNDKVMYHFHKNGIYDDMWTVGNSIIVDDKFNSALVCRAIADFNTNGLNKYKDISLSFIVDEYLKQENDILFTKIFDSVESKEDLMKLLIMSSKVIWEANIFKREMALEEIRRNYFNHLPSRKHCIWVMRKQSIDFWRGRLKPFKEYSNSLILYSVSLTGDLFRTNELFLPSDNYSYVECLEASFDYWNPDFSFTDDLKDEYLFQGEVKILDKVL